MGNDLRPVRGTRDILDEEILRFERILDATRRVSALYGFEPLSTPILEFTEVFKRTLGDASDIVTKEMYTFDDRGGESLTLRPEFTAGVARAFISNGLAQRAPIKLYSHGPLFRYERPQKGRYRQFHQINIEILGTAEPGADVEAITVGAHILDTLGILGKTKLEINSLGDSASRDAYRAALVKYFSGFKNDLSAESKIRLEKNPLRILDSKDPSDKKIVADAPALGEHYSEDAKRFFDTVQEGLTASGVAYTVNPRIVRGLDYYCHTAFEFTTDLLGAQNAVLGGGRYDGLIEQMGGPKTPAVGFAAGIERLALLLDEGKNHARPIAIIPIGAAAEKKAYALARSLRDKKIRVELGFGGNAGKRMKRAAKRNTRAAVIFGDDELASKSYKIKQFDTGKEHTVPADMLAEALSDDTGS
ncbi:MAG: histidine--tRNA ligase [Elusimicrobia bacterium]|nr:MAG: histidine--tRNA ligase [Elusimicrobiota bacterium]